MKKITFLLMLLTLSTLAGAQTKKSGREASIDGTHITPTTAVVVEIVVKKENLLKGPYSRYATQLLGVIAPLNDKVSYSIEAVRIAGSDLGTTSSIALKNGIQKSGFRKGEQVIGENFLDMGIAPVYSETGGEKNLKTMASDAASTIFKLRSRRFDLITGEAGEHVYGEGLKAALDEMARIEKEYLELFVGKRTVEYLTYQYEIIPEKGKLNYMVCRFDADEGIIDGLKITGNPVVLTTINENRVSAEAVQERSKKGSATVSNKTILADIALCKIMLGEELLVEKRIPILQFGKMKEKAAVNETNK